MKEFPILAEGSVEAARISVAIKDTAPDAVSRVPPGALLAAGTSHNAPRRWRWRSDLGLDVDELKTAAADARDVTDNIKEVHELADDARHQRHALLRHRHRGRARARSATTRCRRKSTRIPQMRRHDLLNGSVPRSVPDR